MKRSLGLFATIGLAACLTAYVGCGDDGLGTGGDDMHVGTDIASTLDLAGADLSSSVVGKSDLAGRDFAGVACGAMICNATEACCFGISGMSVTSMCVPSGTCGDGGIPAACDGPEDCSGGTPNCCADISLGSMMSVMGQASCVASCPAVATQGGGGGMIKSKLCHNSADCVGYTGTAPVLGNTAFDRCCGNDAVPIKFCAPGLITAVSNQITCD